jgi:transposase
MSAVSSGDKSFYMIEAVSDRLEGAPLQSRRRWSDEFKARAVARSFAPDANISAVARDVGVAPSQLFDWRRKALRDGTVKKETTPTKLAAVRTDPIGGASCIEIAIGDAVIRAGTEIDEAHLVRVIRAVRAA